MMVSESRWRVDRVVHIYNSAHSLNRLDHHGRRTTRPLQPLIYLRSKKKVHFVPSHRTLFCCTHPRHTHRTTTTLEICIRIY
jgi:hypothetical protein